MVGGVWGKEAAGQGWHWGFAPCSAQVEVADCVEKCWENRLGSLGQADLPPITESPHDPYQHIQALLCSPLKKMFSKVTVSPFLTKIQATSGKRHLFTELSLDWNESCRFHLPVILDYFLQDRTGSIPLCHVETYAFCERSYQCQQFVRCKHLEWT